VQLQHGREVFLLAQPAARAVAAPLVRQEAVLRCKRSMMGQLRGRLGNASCLKSRTWCRHGGAEAGGLHWDEAHGARTAGVADPVVLQAVQHGAAQAAHVQGLKTAVARDAVLGEVLGAGVVQVGPQAVEREAVPACMHACQARRAPQKHGAGWGMAGHWAVCRHAQQQLVQVCTRNACLHGLL